MHDRLGTTVLTAVGALFGHHGGDYLVQLDSWAQRKQQHNPEGRRALALHAASYTATLAATKAALYRAGGVRVPLRAQLAGAIVEGVLHAVIDDGRLLRRFAQVTGKLRFHDLADHGVNGRMLLDQASHYQIQMLAGTVVTGVVAGRAARRPR